MAALAIPRLGQWLMLRFQPFIPIFVLVSLPGGLLRSSTRADEHQQLFQTFCIDCHQGAEAESNLDLSELLSQSEFDAEVVFENLATQKMPPAEAKQPNSKERLAMLDWLAKRHASSQSPQFRRMSRHEFVHSINDLLGTELDLADRIPEDRGTYDFDSDRRIKLSPQMLGSYFGVAQEILDRALPEQGFAREQRWVTNKLMDSHKTYNIYVRDYKDGLLFSWTRANNGNSYSFFYDNFDPPVSGWYELTFEAAKVGDLAGDVSIQVHSGKYYYADDRPQPQRLLDVLSVGSDSLQKYSTRVFLNPGENVSVHCFSDENFRKKDPQKGAYIRQLEVRGPLQDAWPPSRYRALFGELPVRTEGDVSEGKLAVEIQRSQSTNDLRYISNLRRIGGTTTVSSAQAGMEKERLQDGSNLTFWHTRFKPTLAEPPHYVILENPTKHEIEGLSYAAWSGGNGNGLVQQYEIYFSEDGTSWVGPIVSGELETRLANEQPIRFPRSTKSRFIKFLITESFSIDGRSLASIGKLDVMVNFEEASISRSKVIVDSRDAEHLKQVIRRFAERAFVSELTEADLSPYYDAAINTLNAHDDFVQAAKVGFKAVLCSHRFLMAPGEHSSAALAQKATLARTLWLSIPDDDLRASERSLADQIDRMLQDDRAERMLHSFCDQWLNLRSWNRVSPSLKLYPRYDDLLDYYLPLETKAYLGHLIRENMPASHLIDSDYSFLNQRLAKHYELDDLQGQQLRKVSFPGEVQRGGLLTMGSILKVTTDGFDTSPILRGAWISKNIVGTPVSPPPASVKAIEPEHGSESDSLREQIESHKNNETCYACHKSIDPYGFALENFDATGQWRSQYRVEKPHQGTFTFRRQGYYRLAGKVDAAGEINGQPFLDVSGLKEILQSKHRNIAYNFVKKFFQYATGSKPTMQQRVEMLSRIHRTQGENRTKDLVVLALTLALEQSGFRQ
ncbi:MAG: DUF1588 domain-containing protein [Planctomycetota bacterium]